MQGWIKSTLFLFFLVAYWCTNFVCLLACLFAKVDVVDWNAGETTVRSDLLESRACLMQWGLFTGKEPKLLTHIIILIASITICFLFVDII